MYRAFYGIEADRRQLVVREVTLGDCPKASGALDMEQVAVEEVLTKAEDHVADEAGQYDRPDSRGQLLVPRGSEGVSHKRPHNHQMRGDEDGK